MNPTEMCASSILILLSTAALICRQTQHSKVDRHKCNDVSSYNLSLKQFLHGLLLLLDKNLNAGIGQRKRG